MWPEENKTKEKGGEKKKEEIYNSYVCPKQQIIKSAVIIASVVSAAGITLPQAAGGRLISSPE